MNKTLKTMKRGFINAPRKLKMIMGVLLACICAGGSQAFAFATYDAAAGTISWDLSGFTSNIMAAVVAAAALFGIIYSVTWGISFVKSLIAKSRS